MLSYQDSRHLRSLLYQQQCCIYLSHISKLTHDFQKFVHTLLLSAFEISPLPLKNKNNL